MGAVRNNGIQAACVTEKRSRTEAAMLFLPDRRQLTGPALHHVVRLSLLCSNRTERVVVAVHAYQGLSMADAAREAEVSEARARELFASLETRLRAAEAHHRLEERLSHGR